MALFSTVSNAKHAMLGEPLLFSDLALLAAIVRHPRFHFTAISGRERMALAVGAPILLLAFIWLSASDIVPRLIGLGLLLLCGGLGGLQLLGEFLVCRGQLRDLVAQARQILIRRPQPGDLGILSLGIGRLELIHLRLQLFHPSGL